MQISWGYSPKIEKYIPLGDFPADRYLIIARQALENLGWKLSHLSESGLIAYTGLSLQSYSEEISIRIISNFAVAKSECIGVQMLFNDYGKNAQNLDKFFHEFEYVQFHLKDIWEERLQSFHSYIAQQDDTYFERAPLTAKNKIKNVFNLFWPGKGYVVTPIVVNLNIFYWLFGGFIVGLYFGITGQRPESAHEVYMLMGANNRSLALDGQLWRLLSSTFIHGSFWHLFFNMYALVYIGLMIENKFGSWNTLLIYLLSGMVASSNSVIFHDEFGVMLGASGAIMGMFGAFIALILSGAYEKNATRALLISTLLVVTIMLFNGFRSRGVDNAAHLGGLFSGFIIGGLLSTGIFERPWLSHSIRRLSAVILSVLFTAGVFFFSHNYQKQEFVVLLERFGKNSANFSQIYYIERDLPVAAKLKKVKNSGIDVWKNNLKLVQEMEKLRLDKECKIYLNFSRKMANNGYRASQMIYEEYRTGDKSRHAEIIRLLESIYKLQAEMNNEVKKLKAGN